MLKGSQKKKRKKKTPPSPKIQNVVFCCVEISSFSTVDQKNAKKKNMFGYSFSWCLCRFLHYPPLVILSCMVFFSHQKLVDKFGDSILGVAAPLLVEILDSFSTPWVWLGFPTGWKVPGGTFHLWFGWFFPPKKRGGMGCNNKTNPPKFYPKKSECLDVFGWFWVVCCSVDGVDLISHTEPAGSRPSFWSVSSGPMAGTWLEHEPLKIAEDSHWIASDSQLVILDSVCAI